MQVVLSVALVTKTGRGELGSWTWLRTRYMWPAACRGAADRVGIRSSGCLFARRQLGARAAVYF